MQSSAFFIEHFPPYMENKEKEAGNAHILRWQNGQVSYVMLQR